MKSIEINTSFGSSTIFTGSVIQKLEELLPKNNVFIITDENVNKTYANIFPNFPVFSLIKGEESKHWDFIPHIFHWLLVNNANRNSFILGFGGGVVSDISGFVAATFMRGVQCGIVSTSLLSQVDASVGGKNGVNFEGYKNIIGTFLKPKFVICDPIFLKTLSQDQYLSGLAEIIKHIIINDNGMFSFFEQNLTQILERDLNTLKVLIQHSIETKASIVRSDEKESGERKKLNLGHTWGHAVEKVTSMPHGFCVAIGLRFAAFFSVSMGFANRETCLQISELLKKLKFPLDFDLDKATLLNSLGYDKKRAGDNIDFVFIHSIGDVRISSIPLKSINSFIENNKNGFC